MTMDIRLKERLVGAVVLVLAAVLFIPMVLDGPNADRKVTQSVALPDRDTPLKTVQLDLAAPPSDVQPDELAAREAEPADRVPQQQAPAPASVPESVPEAKQVRQTAVESPARAAATAGSPWTVQAGSFSSQDNAEALAARLRQLGFPSYVSRHSDGATTHYRVRVGGFPSRGAAQAMADDVRAKTGEPAAPTPNR